MLKYVIKYLESKFQIIKFTFLLLKKKKKKMNYRMKEGMNFCGKRQ